jgi:hypothetical protein
MTNRRATKPCIHCATPVRIARVACICDTCLEKGTEWQKGKADRKAGKPCESANGAYLDGWYGDY